MVSERAREVGQEVRRRLAELVEELWPKNSISGVSYSRVEIVATAVLIAAGLFFRSRGMLFGERVEMWNDETSWAMRMFERPLSEHPRVGHVVRLP
jgi:hypothetical protein